MSNKFNRDISQLEKNAVYWWPDFLAELETNASIIPELLETQDKFLSLLNLADSEPFKIFEMIKTSAFPANLFLKHLVVLADFGGEPIQRLNRNFSSIFHKNDSGKYGFTFSWKEKEYSYEFKELPIRGNLNNKKLGIDGSGLSVQQELNSLKEDLVAILLFGANALDENTADALSKCEVGSLLGRKEELEKYVKQKYIWVSRITGGAQANTLGQVAQTFVVDFLKKKLGKGYKVTRNGSIKVAGTPKPIPFDVVVSKGKKMIGIEITFQVTTNSTIERKSGQAKSRYELMHKQGYYLAYIIDGAGNFQRTSAISTICNHSDCTVAYSPKEFGVLSEFIGSVL